ncbi:MAG TPA: dTDP-4-amino-4,6-dideoxygalactose transaminase [bacterium]|nr:dTDP-4-amino-4,6-dideoxygalactose transaminase [bacterium]
MNAPIPFHQPILAGNELRYVEESLKSGRLAASGPFSKKASTFLREQLGAAEVFLTTSCTDALEMGVLLLGLEPGDIAILPSFTFVSTALALVRRGVKLIFADIERETFGLDPAHVAELLDDKVKVIVPVHYAGVACDLAGIEKVLGGRPIDLMEDNAQGLFASYQGKPLGSRGRISALSFHETKNLTCGEGGALVVNRTADLDRAHLLYDKGTNRRAFQLGQVDKYSWVDEGSSFGLSDLLAAALWAQLEQRDAIQSRRKTLWGLYHSLLTPAAARLGFQVPRVPPDREQPYHMYYVLLKDRSERDRVLKALGDQGIQATFHYTPLHSAPGAKKHLARPTDCPVTEEVSGRLLRLPFHNALTDDQVRRVAATFLEALERP